MLRDGKRNDQVWFAIGMVLLVLGLALPSAVGPGPIADYGSPFLVGIAIALNILAIFQMVKHDKEKGAEQPLPKPKRRR